jgi:hypothetical protein
MGSEKFMTREEAVEFARKAGHPQPNMDGLFHQRVANLVAAAEREACALICDKWAKTAEARLIRARSQS